MPTHSILITGGDSMLAHYLRNAFDGRVVCLSRRELDIGSPIAFGNALDRHQPDLVINTAGTSQGDLDNLFKVNALFPANLAEQCEQQGVGFMFLSSSRVFDGTGHTPYVETDRPNPIDPYGLSKFAGEKLVALAAPTRHLIIRLPKVLGARHRRAEDHILYQLLTLARQGETIRVANDIFHSPVFAGDIATRLSEMAHYGLTPGIYHLTNGTHVSLYELVCQIMKNCQVPATIQPSLAASFGRPSPPACQSLGSTSLPYLPDWRQAAALFSQNLIEEIANG